MAGSIADLLFKLTPVDDGDSPEDVTDSGENNTDEVELRQDSHDGENVTEDKPEEPNVESSNVELLEQKIDLLEKRINDLITHAPRAIKNAGDSVDSISEDDSADLRELDWTITKKERSE